MKQSEKKEDEVDIPAGGTERRADPGLGLEAPSFPLEEVNEWSHNLKHQSGRDCKSYFLCNQ